ncbi:helix-turn-helix transcriptional regulator [Anaerolineales bacterium HSG24]|nr:helix-turn-helix transcriptional regulator [Anaerolineales bacterium HSG24]
MGTIKTKLFVVRAKKGIKSMQIVAKETGLSPATLYNFENGRTKRVDYNTLASLCQYFGCEVGDLLEYVEDEE